MRRPPARSPTCPRGGRSLFLVLLPILMLFLSLTLFITKSTGEFPQTSTGQLYISRPSVVRQTFSPPSNLVFSPPLPALSPPNHALNNTSTITTDSVVQPSKSVYVSTAGFGAGAVPLKSRNGYHMVDDSAFYKPVAVPPPGCPAKYVYPQCSYGRFNNQLVGLFAAIAYAKQLNRTLILPKFVDFPIMYAVAGERVVRQLLKVPITPALDAASPLPYDPKFVDPRRLFDLSALSDLCVVPYKDVLAADEEARARGGVGVFDNAWCALPTRFDRKKIDFTRNCGSGVWTYLRGVAGAQAYHIAPKDALLHHLGEAYWNQPPVPPGPSFVDFYRILRPSAEIAREVVVHFLVSGTATLEQVTASGLFNAALVNAPAEAVATALPFAAVHARVLEGFCLRYLALSKANFAIPDDQYPLLKLACASNTTNLLINLESFGVIPARFPKDYPFYEYTTKQPLKALPLLVASDRQNPGLDGRLEDIGGIFYTPSYWKAGVLDDREKGLSAAQLAALLPPPLWRYPPDSTAATAVDFWILVASQVFIGNPVSTLSWNVCGVRKAWLSPDAPCGNIDGLKGYFYDHRCC